MRDIWAFLIQTLSASGAALLLLLLKAIFRDKLSPRWQFGIWGILGLTLLTPAGLFGRYALVNWPLAVETLKTLLTGDLTLTRVVLPIPLPQFRLPTTLWDWLFLIYLVGVLVLLMVGIWFVTLALCAVVEKVRSKNVLVSPNGIAQLRIKDFLKRNIET